METLWCETPRLDRATLARGVLGLPADACIGSAERVKAKGLPARLCACALRVAR